MMSLPDFKQKSVLIFESYELLNQHLRFSNQNIIFEKENNVQTKISIFRVLAIFIIGEFSITTKLIQQCQKHGFSLFLLKRNLNIFAEFCSQAEGNVLLRKKQYYLSSQVMLAIAKKIVENKIRNQMNLLRYIDINEILGVERKTYRKNKIATAYAARHNKALLGLEGSVSRDFFGLYFAELNWQRRMPRSKIDELNVLLDIGYSLLFSYIEALCHLFGFDIYKGVYHQLFYHRKSLICDLMEPFRCIIDKAVLKGFRLGQFDKNDFSKEKCQYSLPYKNSGKYTTLFLKEILNYKEEIYNYIRNYYYFILNDAKQFPNFIIR